MIKRISLVWKRPELTDEEFRRLWLGEHAVYAKQLPGLRGYSIDFVAEATDGAPSAVATVRFDDRSALDSAFAIPHLKEKLIRSREQFAAAVQIMFVEEIAVVP